MGTTIWLATVRKIRATAKGKRQSHCTRKREKIVTFLPGKCKLSVQMVFLCKKYKFLQYVPESLIQAEAGNKPFRPLRPPIQGLSKIFEE